MTHELISGSTSTVARVYAIRLPGGDRPALTWLTSLDKAQKAAIGSRLERLAAVGWLRSPDAFNNLAPASPTRGMPRVDEIKHVGRDLRLYDVAFSAGDTSIYVTHGTKKPKKSRVAHEVAKARTIYEKADTGEPQP